MPSGANFIRALTWPVRAWWRASMAERQKLLRQIATTEARNHALRGSVILWDAGFKPEADDD